MIDSISLADSSDLFVSLASSYDLTDSRLVSLVADRLYSATGRYPYRAELESFGATDINDRDTQDWHDACAVTIPRLLARLAQRWVAEYKYEENYLPNDVARWLADEVIAEFGREPTSEEWTGLRQLTGLY